MAKNDNLKHFLTLIIYHESEVVKNEIPKWRISKTLHGLENNSIEQYFPTFLGSRHPQLR